MGAQGRLVLFPLSYHLLLFPYLYYRYLSIYRISLHRETKYLGGLPCECTHVYSTLYDCPIYIPWFLIYRNELVGQRMSQYFEGIDTMLPYIIVMSVVAVMGFLIYMGHKFLNKSKGGG